jgi:putative transposase
MARKLRVQYPGAMYHVMNRGDRREAIFTDEEDHKRFLVTLGEACEKTCWQVHAFCLMSNHFHLVIETPQPNLVVGMKWLLGTYTSRYNRRHKEFGHLFSGRYKALPVDGSGTGYLKTACDYVHLNPARAKLLRPDQPLESFRWSSYRLYLAPPSRRPMWLRADRLLGEWGIQKDSPAGRCVFKQHMERRRLKDLDKAFKRLERGWFLGGEDFKQELLAQVDTAPGPSHFGDMLHEAMEARAERLLNEALTRMGWTKQHLHARLKGDPHKVAIARQLRAQTTMSMAWIAEHLAMGSRGYLAWLLQRPSTAEPNNRQPLLGF